MSKQRLSNVRERVLRAIHALHVLLLQQRVDRLLDVWNLWRKARQNMRNHLLDQGLHLRCFSRLHDSTYRRHRESINTRERKTKKERNENVPDNRRLNSELAILVDTLEHLGRLGLLGSLDRLVQVDPDFLVLEVYITSHQSRSE